MSWTGLFNKHWQMKQVSLLVTEDGEKLGCGSSEGIEMESMVLMYEIPRRFTTWSASVLGGLLVLPSAPSQLAEMLADLIYFKLRIDF